MPKQPQRAEDPEAITYVNVRVPGWLKNQVLDLAADGGVSVNTLLLTWIHLKCREAKGMPEPPPARAPLPNIADEIRAWAAGETILTPCGKTGTCAGTEQESIRLCEALFCPECSIRLG